MDFNQEESIKRILDRINKKGVSQQRFLHDLLSWSNDPSFLNGFLKVMVDPIALLLQKTLLNKLFERDVKRNEYVFKIECSNSTLFIEDWLVEKMVDDSIQYLTKKGFYPNLQIDSKSLNEEGKTKMSTQDIPNKDTNALAIREAPAVVTENATALSTAKEVINSTPTGSAAKVSLDKKEVQATAVDNTPEVAPETNAENPAVAESVLVAADINESKTAAIENEAKVATESDEVKAETAAADFTGRPLGGPQWKYLPLPDEPDRHEESDSKFLQISGGLKLIGARVRGKKHKHEGTNCDDWFEFESLEDWTIIAVSDGAGLKKFSRVGAEASCQAAVDYLTKQLRQFELTKRGVWTPQVFARDKETYEFIEEDWNTLQNMLHQAMQVAYATVEKAAKERSGNVEHAKVLGRPLEVNDLSSTLLLALHKTIPYNGKDHSLVMTCQIGDGMSAIINREGRLTLMGLPDSGQFSGETEFLTSKSKLDKANLVAKTFLFFQPIRALMVMTDGVADDYFPNDPQLIRLFCDLILNGIIEPKAGPLPDIGYLKKEQYSYPTESVSSKGERKLIIPQAGVFAEDLKLKIEDLITKPELLVAGASKELQEESVQERLRLWLDAYYVRGSFDDRTLVVLYKEELLK